MENNTKTREPLDDDVLDGVVGGSIPDPHIKKIELSFYSSPTSRSRDTLDPPPAPVLSNVQADPIPEYLK